MNVSQSEFQYMVEGMTADLIVLLIQREGYTTEQAVSAVYGSRVYEALRNPRTTLYYQSPGYVYSHLVEELKQQ